MSTSQPREVNVPRSTFLNRAASPFVAISRVIAAWIVDSGVLPPGLIQRLRFCISAMSSVHRIGRSLVASTRAAASRALMRFSRNGFVAGVVAFAVEWGWALLPLAVAPLLGLGVASLPALGVPAAGFLVIALGALVGLLLWAVVILLVS